MANTPNDHSSKKEPITSFGILLYHIDPGGKIWYLLAQRRDTIEYADYLRGRYSYPNLYTYFSLMTLQERERLRNHDFKTLWDDLWVDHNNRLYKEYLPKALLKFEANKKVMFEFLDNTTSNVQEPGWGFPKGKKNGLETELECAIREFTEETRLSIDYLNLINISPIREIFKGSNGKMYSTVYYFAQVDHLLPIHKIHTGGLREDTISEEISNLLWVPLEEAVKFLPHCRQKLLRESEEKIKTLVTPETTFCCE